MRVLYLLVLLALLLLSSSRRSITSGIPLSSDSNAASLTSQPLNRRIMATVGENLSHQDSSPIASSPSSIVDNNQIEQPHTSDTSSPTGGSPPHESDTTTYTPELSSREHSRAPPLSSPEHSPEHTLANQTEGLNFTDISHVETYSHQEEEIDLLVPTLVLLGIIAVFVLRKWSHPRGYSYKKVENMEIADLTLEPLDGNGMATFDPNGTVDEAFFADISTHEPDDIDNQHREAPALSDSSDIDIVDLGFDHYSNDHDLVLDYDRDLADFGLRH